MDDTDCPVHPPSDQRLQAGLTTEMLHIGIVGRHGFPRINLQNRVLRRALVWRPIALCPGEPPVVDVALLLAADFAVKSFSPRHGKCALYFSRENSGVFAENAEPFACFGACHAGRMLTRAVRLSGERSEESLWPRTLRRRNIIETKRDSTPLRTGGSE